MNALVKEVRLIWNLLQNNLLAHLIPTTMFTVTAWNLLDGSVEILPISLGFGLLFGFLYSYSFDITQQLISIPEDKINKPHRPLITGLLSIRGAYVRCIIIHVAFFVFGLVFDILIYVVMWQVVTLLYKFSKYWVYKSFVMTIGVISMLGGAWNLVGPLPQEVLMWIIIVGVNIFFIVPLQDLRDVKGDLSIKRKTLPILYGIQKTRYYLATMYILVNPLLNYFYLFPLIGTNNNSLVLFLGILLSLYSIHIGLRILYKKTRKNDKITYTLLVGWYWFLLLSANFIFENLQY